MVMEMEADMETVLERFDLLLDRDGGRGGSTTAGSTDRSRSPGDAASGGGGNERKEDEAGAGSGVKERIARALRLYKESAAADGDVGDGVLVQAWAPALDHHESGAGRVVLATRGQPFVLLAPPPRSCHRRLFQYRTVSLTHAFPVGGPGAAAAGERGLPGRVFDAGAPEWTPNVQYYGSGEYARISHALVYDIQAAMALPVLDPASGACLAVLELVMTSHRLRFADEVARLCRALQALALRGADICRPVVAEVDDEAARPAMSEVSELLTAVCEAHGLPLAQAWIRCGLCGALTAAGAPFHLGEGGDEGGAARGFRDACTELHLRSGSAGGGLVGEAVAARGPRFCADVAAAYSMDAYPLAHHARFSGLAGCLAVPVTCARGGGREQEEEWCVLEFFLPPECRGGAAQKAAAAAVVATIAESVAGGGMKAVAIGGLQDLAFEVAADGECVLRPDRRLAMADATDHTPELEPESHGGGERDSDGEDAAVGSADIEGTNKVGNGEAPRAPGGKKKKTKTKKRKGEKSVSLEELQGYFSGSLKDAARSLGVCPTTMKRICRQHGILRWPFRKIAKANRSLDRIKLVFESVGCSPKPMAAASQQARAAGHHHRPAALPCLSSAVGVASSQGSCQEPPPPPPPKSTTSCSPLHGGDAGVVTVKASYRGDIVRFRVPCSSGVATVKGEVAKRLDMEVDSFDVKYLDDDNEWVLLSCDADFQECLDVVPALPATSSFSGSGVAQPVVRLKVQEVADSYGSSCGSSE